MALEHKHLIVSARGCEWLPSASDVPFMENWLRTLVDTIGMKILMGPFVVYSEMEGNRGFTGVVIIETSHIAIHTWDEDDQVLQLDIYTCSHMEPSDVISMLEVFNPSQADFKFLDREKGLSELFL
jgi:S-adenosylmethionine/arginine decarboxylase-like enzyme